MLEKEFAQRYKAIQNSTHAPADVMEATRALVDYTQKNETVRLERDHSGTHITETPLNDAPETAGIKGAEGTAFSALLSDVAPKASKSHKPTKRPSTPTRRTKRHRWMMPVAACLAALLVLFGVGSAVLPFVQQQPAARAYARTPNLLTAGLDSGIIPFAFDERLEYQGGGAPWSDGIFTTMQFTVGAENVSRIQATLSRGELCLVTTETLERCDPQEDPVQAAKLDEALNWRLANRGTGAYYGDYDGVFYTMHDPSSTLEEYDGPFDVRLIKRVGSTIDVAYEGEPLTFCFWYGNDDITFYQETNIPQLVGLNGDELTLTTQFDDSTFRTQTIELHDGWFAWNDGPYGRFEMRDSVMAEGPFKTLRECEKAVADSDPPYQFKADTLFGVVTAVTDNPHPFPLDNANAQLNEPVEPHIVTLEESLGPERPDTAIPATPDEEQIVPAGSVIRASGAHTSLDMGEALRKLQWSNISASLSSVLPGGFNVHEARESIRFFDDLDYLNRCRMATHGWSVSGKSIINEGRSFLTVSMTITNETDETVNFSAYYLGTVCAVDDDSDTTMLPAYRDVYVAKDAAGRLLSDDIAFQPHESIDVRAVFIVSDKFVQSGELLYTPDPLAFEPSIAFPNRKHTFNFAPYQFISLGKLDRR